MYWNQQTADYYAGHCTYTSSFAYFQRNFHLKTKVTVQLITAHENRSMWDKSAINVKWVWDTELQNLWFLFPKVFIKNLLNKNLFCSKSFHSNGDDFWTKTLSFDVILMTTWVQENEIKRKKKQEFPVLWDKSHKWNP